MRNRSGCIYGFTSMAPIRAGPAVGEPYTAAVRARLARLPRHERSPFARVSRTHIARLFVLDDVPFVGAPAREEHLESSYLVFAASFDGDLDTYLEDLARRAARIVNSIWSHCVAFPGANDVGAFVAYMKRCQVDNAAFFAAVNDRTVQQTLRAIQVQAHLAAFIEEHQGEAPDMIRVAFEAFLDRLAGMPSPAPGARSLRIEQGDARPTASSPEA